MGAGGGVRATAARVVQSTLAGLRSAETSLARASVGLDERDRRLLAELAYGTLRWRARLEWVIERASGRGLGKIDAELVPVLAVAVFQLLFLDRIPAHAAVSEAVDEARRRRGRPAAGFVNAVLRRIAREPALAGWPVEIADPVRRLAVEQSHPEALVRRWAERFGLEAAQRMAAAGNAPRDLHLLAFADRGGRDALADRLAGEGIATDPAPLSPLGLVVRSGRPLESAAFREGDFYVQDEASQAAALVPAPRPGERVLDAAAAPGGKGLALIAAEPRARVVFAEGSSVRVGRLRTNLRRLGRTLPIVVASALEPPWRGGFDRVVLDAPCTGTGTLRRHPELRWRFRVAELERLAAASLAMLEALSRAVAAGGLLVHVTCSVETEENERTVDRFLAAHDEFAPAPLEELAPSLQPGRLAPGRWRVLPGEGHDGFSVAVLRRAR